MRTIDLVLPSVATGVLGQPVDRFVTRNYVVSPPEEESVETYPVPTEIMDSIIAVLNSFRPQLDEETPYSDKC